jgi:hypothetical protein
MVQDVAPVWNGHARTKKLGDSEDDLVRLEVAPWVVVPAHYEDPRMVPSQSDGEILQIIEVTIISGKNNPVGANGVRKVDGITAAGHSRGGRPFNIVTSPAKRADQ